MLLLTSYLPDHDLYIVVPVEGRPADPDYEYVFATERDQMNFIQQYYRNPIAAMYAYRVRLGEVA